MFKIIFCHRIGQPLLVMVCAGLITGCDGYTDTREHEAKLEIADYNGWLRARAQEEGEVIRKIGDDIVGSLKSREEVTVQLTITGAHDGVVVGGCDFDCVDLDLNVVGSNGQTVGVDEEDDNYPMVHVDADKPQVLSVRVRMAKCNSRSCAYAIGQFEYDDYSGASGTCFAVAPNGLVMTSLHVVEDAETITVAFTDGRKGTGKIIRRSTDNDLALIQTELATPEWLPLAEGSDINVGMPVFTLGFPAPHILGSEVKFTEGSVSALSGFEEESTLLQVSVPIQPGNSGGPVVSHAGMVVGVVEASVKKDWDGNPMQLTNFARSARVAALLMPAQASQRLNVQRTNRDGAVDRALNAVCQVKAT